MDGQEGMGQSIMSRLSLCLRCYSLCMGTAGGCGGEGAVRTVGGGVLDLPSPSEVGPEPLRTELSRSANFVAAGVTAGRHEEGQKRK